MANIKNKFYSRSLPALLGALFLVALIFAIFTVTALYSHAQTLPRRPSYLSSTQYYGELQKFNTICSIKQPLIKVQIAPMPTILNIKKTQSVEQLSARNSQLSNSTPEKMNGSAGLVWGTTEAVYHLETKYPLINYRSGELNSSCAIPGVELVIGYKAIDINMARELAPDSCIYQHILGHEIEHVKIYQRSLFDLQRSLTQTLEAKLKDKIFLSENAQRAEAKALEYIQSFLYKDIELEMQKISQRQQDFDSPEESNRGMLACSGELGRLIMNLKKE